jgi:HEAT repeat protein
MPRHRDSVRRALFAQDPLRDIERATRRWPRRSDEFGLLTSALPGGVLSVAVALASRSAVVRRHALEDLRLNHRSVLSLLARGLSDPDPTVRVVAEKHLRATAVARDSIGDVSVADLGPLIFALTCTSIPDDDVGPTVVRAFPKAAREALVIVAAQGTPVAQARAIYLLEVIGDPEAFDAIASACRHRHRSVREAAVAAVPSLCTDRRAFDLLVQTCSDQSADVRRWSLAGLGTIYRAVAGTHDFDTGIAAHLVRRALDDRSPDVRVEAVRQLGILGPPDMHDLLIHIVEDERDFQPFAAAAHALAEIGDSRAIATLASRLGVRAELSDVTGLEAAKALALAGDPAIPALVDAAKDAKAERRSDAFFGIERLPMIDRSCAAVLAESLHDDDNGARVRCADALGNARMPLGVRQELLQHQDPDVRQRAIPIFESVVALCGQELLDLARNDPVFDVRIRALGSLHSRATSETDALLYEFLADPDPAVRAKAIFPAMLHARNATTAKVRELLNDPDAAVREAAAAELDRLAFLTSDATATEPTTDTPSRAGPDPRT